MQVPSPHSSPLPSTWNFNLCTYNIMVPVPEPIRHNGQRKRISLLPEAIRTMSATTRQGIDVITFQELIPLEYRNTLLNELTALGWKYHSEPLVTTLLSGHMKAVNGGVVIVSRHPIIAQFHSVFETECQSADCASCKGAVYSRILLPNENVINVFSTHFQAWDTAKAREIRRQQAAQCLKFIQSLHIPSDEALVFSGDFNIDFYTNTTEILTLMSSMGLEMVKRAEDSHPFTSDPRTNAMMGNDETTMYATEKYPHGCYEEYLQTLSCPCCPCEWLDYIAYSTEHLKPKRAEVRVYLMKTPVPFTMKLNITTERQISDLSDHYPLISQFTWSKSTPFKRRVITCDMYASYHPWWVITVLLIIALSILLLAALGTRRMMLSS